eukprot:2286528-Pyramimonas_sp.AAC.1
MFCDWTEPEAAASRTLFGAWFQGPTGPRAGFTTRSRISQRCANSVKELGEPFITVAMPVLRAMLFDGSARPRSWPDRSTEWGR